VPIGSAFVERLFQEHPAPGLLPFTQVFRVPRMQILSFSSFEDQPEICFLAVDGIQTQTFCMTGKYSNLHKSSIGII
jgi:hypothetical protein